MRTVITTLLTFVLNFSALADETKESVQISATRKMNELLVLGKFEEVYRDWCHPHLQGQFDKEGFVESMKKDWGKDVLKVFSDVVKAINDKAGPDVLVAQFQEDKDEYQFILVQVRKNNWVASKGSPWHIELKLHDGKWKLMDID